MSIQIEQKSFGYVPALLDKIEACITDIGWLRAFQLRQRGSPQRVVPYTANMLGAESTLRHLLDRAKKDSATHNWFAEMNARLKGKYPEHDDSLEELLNRVLAHSTSGHAQEQYNLCLEATEMCHVLRHRLHQESREFENPIGKLLDYSGT